MQKLHAPLRKEAIARAKELFRSVKDAMMPDLMVLQPAYAGVEPGCMPPIRVSWPEPAKANINRFDTGPAPSSGSPSRTIMDWGEVDILLPGEAPVAKDRKYIDYRKAQDEVANLLKSKESSHPYLSYEAAKLLSSHPLVQRYTLHLMVGSLAEDYVFAPGETMDKIVLSDIKRLPQKRDELSHMAGYEDVPSITTGIFSVFSDLWKWISGGGQKDEVNRPYFAHFCQVLSDGTRRGLEIAGGDLRFQSARDRMKEYWSIASGYYRRGDMPRAFCALGHLIHLAQDLHVPAHVHNDIHGPTVILGKLDSLESWCKKADYADIARKPDEPNIRIWSSKPIAPPAPDASWAPANGPEKLDAFIDAVAANTQRYRSVDHEGTAQDQKATGKLSDKECHDQCNLLIPLAIYKSAWLVSEFLDYHKRVYGIG
jgi:hypothetical protein